MYCWPWCGHPGWVFLDPWWQGSSSRCHASGMTHCLHKMLVMRVVPIFSCVFVDVLA